MYENLLLTSLISKNSSLLFTIEQWELTRRLKNSGLTKEQLCQAYDDLDRIEAELGQLYNVPASVVVAATKSQNDKTVKSNKNNSITESPSFTAPFLASASNAATLVNSYFSSVLDADTESKQLDEFRSKGELIVQKEIEFFVHKHDLKQSQIARMAGVNQAYVSKFLRGEFSDLSENGKTLIYKWYLRFLKNPKIYLQSHNITLSGSALFQEKIKQATPVNPPTTSSFSSSFMPTINYDMPKRTRFSFKPEHLTILEREFISNQYPDQKKREELARLCNESRPCSERERVTEQVITHWFQNKRKLTKKSNLDDSFSTSSTSNGARSALNSLSNNKYEETISLAALNSSNFLFGGDNPLGNDDEDDDDEEEEEEENEDNEDEDLY